MHNNIGEFNPLDVLAAAAALQSATNHEALEPLVDLGHNRQRLRSSDSESSASQVKNITSLAAVSNRQRHAMKVIRTRTKSNVESRQWYKYLDKSETGLSCYLDHSYATVAVLGSESEEKLVNENGDLVCSKKSRFTNGYSSDSDNEKSQQGNNFPVVNESHSYSVAEPVDESSSRYLACNNKKEVSTYEGSGNVALSNDTYDKAKTLTKSVDDSNSNDVGCIQQKSKSDHPPTISDGGDGGESRSFVVLKLMNKDVSCPTLRLVGQSPPSSSNTTEPPKAHENITVLTIPTIKPEELSIKEHDCGNQLPSDTLQDVKLKTKLDSPCEKVNRAVVTDCRSYDDNANGNCAVDESHDSKNVSNLDPMKISDAPDVEVCDKLTRQTSSVENTSAKEILSATSPWVHTGVPNICDNETKTCANELSELKTNCAASGGSQLDHDTEKHLHISCSDCDRKSETDGLLHSTNIVKPLDGSVYEGAVISKEPEPPDKLSNYKIAASQNISERTIVANKFREFVITGNNCKEIHVADASIPSVESVVSTNACNNDLENKDLLPSKILCKTDEAVALRKESYAAQSSKIDLSDSTDNIRNVIAETYSSTETPCTGLIVNITCTSNGTITTPSWTKSKTLCAAPNVLSDKQSVAGHIPTSVMPTRMLGTVVPNQRPMIAVPLIAVPINKKGGSATTVFTPRLPGQPISSFNTNLGTILVPSNTVPNPVINPARRTSLFKNVHSSSLGFAGSFQLVTGNLANTPLSTLNGGIIDDLSGAGKLIGNTGRKKDNEKTNELNNVSSNSLSDVANKTTCGSTGKFNRYLITHGASESSSVHPITSSSAETSPNSSVLHLSPGKSQPVMASSPVSSSGDITELIKASATATQPKFINSPLNDRLLPNMVRNTTQVVHTFPGVTTNMTVHKLPNNGMTPVFQSELAHQLITVQNRSLIRQPKDRTRLKLANPRSRMEGVRPLSYHAATQVHENLRPHPLRDHDYCLHSFYQVVAFTKQEEKREIKLEKEQKKLDEKLMKKKKKELLRLKKQREIEAKSRKYKKRNDKTKKKKKKKPPVNFDSETSEFSPEKQTVKLEPPDSVNLEMNELLHADDIKLEQIDTSSEVAASDSIKSEPSSPGSFYSKDGRNIRKNLRIRNDDRVKITGTSSFKNQFVYFATKKPRRRNRHEPNDFMFQGLKTSSSADFLPGLDATYLEAKAKFVAAQQKKEEILNSPSKPSLSSLESQGSTDAFSVPPTASAGSSFNSGQLTPEIDHLEFSPEFLHTTDIPKGKLAVGVTEEESNFLETLCSEVHGTEPNQAADLSQELDNMGFHLTPEQVKEFLATFGVEKAAKLLTGDPDLKLPLAAESPVPSELSVEHEIISEHTIEEKIDENLMNRNPPMISGLSSNSDVLSTDQIVASSPLPSIDSAHTLPNDKDTLHSQELGADLVHDQTPQDLFDLDTSDLFSECLNINSILNFQSPEKALHSSQSDTSITQTRKLDFEGLDDKVNAEEEKRTNEKKFAKPNSEIYSRSRASSIHNRPQGNNFTIGKPESMFKSQFMKGLVCNVPEVTDPGVPDLVMVNMYWNDLPGLKINDTEHVRLVDIHKQVLPAKPTGLLKNRCRALNLEFKNSTELQRDFLIRYAHAAQSRSTLIVTKEVAETLIGYYVNPPPRAARTDAKDDVDEVVDTDDESRPPSSVASNEEFIKAKRRNKGSLARWQRRRKQQRLARKQKNAKKLQSEKSLKILVNLKQKKAAIRDPSVSPEGMLCVDASSDNESDVQSSTSSDSDDTTNRLEKIRKLRNRAKYLRSEILKVSRQKDSILRENENQSKVIAPSKSDDVKPDTTSAVDMKIAPDLESIPSLTKSNPQVTTKLIKVSPDLKKQTAKVIQVAPSLESECPSRLQNENSDKVINVSKTIHLPTSDTNCDVVSEPTVPKSDSTNRDNKVISQNTNTVCLKTDSEIKSLETDDLGIGEKSTVVNGDDEKYFESDRTKKDVSPSTYTDVYNRSTNNITEQGKLNKRDKVHISSPVNICRMLNQVNIGEIEVIELSDDCVSPKKQDPKALAKACGRHVVMEDNGRICLDVEHYDKPLQNGKRTLCRKQRGVLRLDLFGTKSAECLQCSTCLQEMSLASFLKHQHSLIDTVQLLEVSVPKKLKLVSDRITSQHVKHWNEFKFRQKRFNHSSDAVRSLQFEDASPEIEFAGDTTVRQSKRARKPKQLFSFENYVYTDSNSSASNTENDFFIDDIDESLVVENDTKVVDNLSYTVPTSGYHAQDNDTISESGFDFKFKRPTHNVPRSSAASTVRRRSEGHHMSSMQQKRHVRSKSSPELYNLSPAKKRKIQTSPLSPRSSTRRAMSIKLKR